MLTRCCIGSLQLMILSCWTTCLLAAAPNNPLAVPQVGDHQLRILSPRVLELSLVTTKEPDPARVTTWDFVGENARLQLPALSNWVVRINGSAVSVKAAGFKRRVLYAPLKRRELRIGNWLYLELGVPVRDGQTVQVTNPNEEFWPKTLSFTATAAPQRLSPVIHVNQAGYVPGQSKKAMIGFYLGSLGELQIAPTDTSAPEFVLIDADTGRGRYRGRLARRPERGFTFETYTQVWEADFSAYNEPGRYRLFLPGFGVSYPFAIDNGIFAAFARTYALGLYHQRCGTNNILPLTRFTHAPCHLSSAEIPTSKSETTERFLKEITTDSKSEPRHTAPALAGVQSALYPFVRRNKVDVSGGHHDAGDYSKYTINSAGLIHHLVFAADAFPGAAALDNLGLPESGDGKSDLLQEAKWEADFLAKMQDADGGFYFLVYPQLRKYEDNVLPDKGDPQVVWPKNTSATAAAVAALAQASSSPRFKHQFPDAAKRYLDQALKGWRFLERAVKKHGMDGAYQQLTHYGHEFLHDDELAWAAAELYLATGNPEFERWLIERFDPTAESTRRWTWWRLYEGYGCAVRSYAFAARTGRLKPDQLNRDFLQKCESEIVAAAEDQFRFARDSAYGTSFPEPTKRFRTAGWYFSTDRAFDLVVAMQLDSAADRRADFLEAYFSNLNYEAGCNPLNVSYLTGMGWKRQHEIVHQYAQNDRRTLPPTGIPIGNVQAGFQFLHHYGKELGALSFPHDGSEDQPYPFYDRWGDSFNVATEFVVVNQARSLAGLSFLMAQTPLQQQAYPPIRARIIGIPQVLEPGAIYTAELQLNADLRNAQIVWEAPGHEPTFGPRFRVSPVKTEQFWVEAEVLWPDGRRAFAITGKP